MEAKKRACPVCEGEEELVAIDRRDFMKTVGVTAATAAVSTVPLWATPRLHAAPTKTSAAETAVKALYDSLTPMEFLRFIGRVYGMTDSSVNERARELLRLLGLVAEVDNRMSTFSKGMRQKVLLVAGLIHNPDVIVLDEPLSGLDANSVVTVKEILSRLAHAGKTIFYCSHVMDVVERVCHRIVIINDGHIVADGAFEELQAMNKAASLERIFTKLTSAGGQEAVADNFVHALGATP